MHKTRPGPLRAPGCVVVVLVPLLRPPHRRAGHPTLGRIYVLLLPIIRLATALAELIQRIW
jgi:hypothetical protein